MPIGVLVNNYHPAKSLTGKWLKKSKIFGWQAIGLMIVPITCELDACGKMAGRDFWSVDRDRRVANRITFKGGKQTAVIIVAGYLARVTKCLTVRLT